MLDFLHWIRDAEFDLIFSRVEMPLSDKSLLEIGAGSGYQLAMLRHKVAEAVGVDISASNYAEVRSAEVILYDGHHLPFEDQRFDIIFSSNTLEHIPHLGEIHQEFKRVLKPGGICIHVVPTHHWKIRQILGFYLLLPLTLWRRVFPERGKIQKAGDPNAQEVNVQTVRTAPKSLSQKLRNLLLPEHHGERGNVFSEYFYFRPKWWQEHFEQNQWQILKNEGLGLFYSPYGMLGKKLPLATRKAWSKTLGSSCQLFIIQPK